MSKRNLIWLVVVVAVALIAGFVGGWLIGVIAAVVMLAISEVVERNARRQRLAADRAK